MVWTSDGRQNNVLCFYWEGIETLLLQEVVLTSIQRFCERYGRQKDVVWFGIPFGYNFLKRRNIIERWIKFIWNDDQKIFVLVTV